MARKCLPGRVRFVGRSPPGENAAKIGLFRRFFRFFRGPGRFATVRFDLILVFGGTLSDRAVSGRFRSEKWGFSRGQFFIFENYILRVFFKGLVILLNVSKLK